MPCRWRKYALHSGAIGSAAATVLAGAPGVAGVSIQYRSWKLLPSSYGKPCSSVVCQDARSPPPSFTPESEVRSLSLIAAGI